MRVDVSGDYGKAQFKVSSLYKGKIGETVMVYFTKNTVPSILIQPGEDWILYCKYVTGKPFLDPCSRSRKNIINTNKNVELMYAKSEITVDEECAQLKEWFGIQIPKGNITESESHRNIIPDGIQRIVLTLVSVLVTIGIYFFISPRKKHNFKK